jgi:hypothetical protein
VCDVSSPIVPIALTWWHTSVSRPSNLRQYATGGPIFIVLTPRCFCAKVRCEANLLEGSFFEIFRPMQAVLLYALSPTHDRK